jgi:SHAQKYF class myb-like DNA-binding protein
MMHLGTVAHLGSPQGPADLDAIPLNNSALPLGMYGMPEIPPLLMFTGVNNNDDGNDIALPLDVHYMKDLVSQKNKKGGVKELQVLCRQKGLPTKGLQADLVRWLAAYGAASTDSGRESAKQSAASESSKIQEDYNQKRRGHIQKCKCKVALAGCKRCWGSNICDHNECKSRCWECAEESPGEGLPLADRTFGQLRIAYDRQGLDDEHCPRAAQNRKLHKSDLLDVLAHLASLGEFERAAQLLVLKARDEKAQAAPWAAPPRAPNKNGLSMSKPSVARRKSSAKESKHHAAQEGAATGAWTYEEHDTFLQGLHTHGRDWKSIRKLVPSRSLTQIRTHAQKHFQKKQ